MKVLNCNHVSTFLCFPGNTQGDSVHQNHSLFLIENEKASLYCQYETTSTAPYLFWYIQRDTKPPELILNHFNIPGNGYKEGFSVHQEKSNKTFNLKIAAAVLSDSATYYCALRPTLCESVPHLIPKPLFSVPNLDNITFYSRAPD